MAERYVLSFRRDEVGGGVTSGLLYSVKLDPGAAVTDVHKFAQQLDAGELQLELVDVKDPLLRYGRVCFLIHGYNTSRSRGLWSGEELGRQDLNYDCVVAVLWPGDSGILGPLVYPWALNNARDAGRNLGRFMRYEVSPTAQVSFVTHSFGVRVALESVATLIGREGQQARRFEEAVFMASAADEAVLTWRVYEDATDAFDRIFIVSSLGDKVLKNFYPAGDWVEDVFFRGERGAHRALGRYGPLRERDDDLNDRLTHVDIAESEKHDHNDYFPWPWEHKPGVGQGGWQPKRERVRTVLARRSRELPPDDPKIDTKAPRYGERRDRGV